MDRAMQAKNLVIGFLLFFLGIGLSAYSLPLPTFAGMTGSIIVIFYAVDKFKREKSDSNAEILLDLRRHCIMQTAMH